MTDPIQQQLIAARRNQILDAAAAIFAEKGFHPTTTKDIARQAGVSDGTIYNYFASKNDLLLGIFDRMKETALQDVALPDTTDLRSFLRAYLRHPLQADNFALFRVVMSEMLVNAELRDLYHAKVLKPTLELGEILLQQWVDQKRIPPIDVSLTIRALSGLMMGLILEYTLGDPTLQAQWDELPDFLADLILNGIASKQP